MQKEDGSVFLYALQCVRVHIEASRRTCLSALSARPMRISPALRQPAAKRRKKKSGSKKGEDGKKEGVISAEGNFSAACQTGRLGSSCPVYRQGPPPLPPLPPSRRHPLPPPLPVAACAPAALDTKAPSALASNGAKTIGESAGFLETNPHCRRCALSRFQPSINHLCCREFTHGPSPT